MNEQRMARINLLTDCAHIVRPGYNFPKPMLIHIEVLGREFETLHARWAGVQPIGEFVAVSNSDFHHSHPPHPPHPPPPHPAPPQPPPPPQPPQPPPEPFEKLSARKTKKKLPTI